MQVVDSSHRSNEAPPDEVARRGIELCRRGEWQEGFYWLSLAADDAVDTSAVPGVFFAYLGYGLARFHGALEEGLKLCHRAVSLDVYQGESYYFLALTHLLGRQRRLAIDTLDRGLQIDATHDGLRALKAELGERRPPLLRFLPRRHFLNRTLGRWRHRLAGLRHAASS